MIALSLHLAHALQGFQQRFVLNPLGRHRQVEPVAHGQDRVDHLVAVLFLLEFGDEGAIDFEAVEGQAAQLRQAGISGAEIVETDVHALIAQAADHRADQPDVFVQAAFGYFDFESIGREVVLDQKLEKFLGEPRIAHLDGRDIDRETEVGIPLLGILESLRNQPFAHLANHADLFGDGDEDIGADDAELGRFPAGQHFEPHESAGLDIDLLFVIRLEFTGRDAAANARFELVAEAQLVFHLGFEPVEAVLSLLLGVIHGDIRLVHQLLGRCGTVHHVFELRARGDPDRHGHIERSFGIGDRFADLLDHARGQLIHAIGYLRMIGYDAHEFVTAEAGENTGVWQKFLYPGRAGAQDFVAGLVTVKVVDLLEIVQIHRDRSDGLFVPRQADEHFPQRGSEAASVVAAGQVIEVGETACFGFRFPAGFELLAQRLVAQPAKENQGDIQQQGGRQRRVRSEAFAFPCGDEVGKNHPRSPDEQDDGGKSDAQGYDVTLAPRLLPSRCGARTSLGHGTSCGQYRPLANKAEEIR